MPDIFPTAQTLTANFCPADWQDVIDEFATKLAISEVTDDEVIIQIADPTPVDDDDKLWIKVTAGAPYVGYALVKQNSKWLHIQGKPLYYADSSAAADAIVLSSTGYGNGAYDAVQYLQDRIFIIRVANTNTGAVTIALDSIPAKALRRDNNTDLAAGEIVAGMLIAVAYDPTDDIFEMLSPIIDVGSATTYEYKSPSAVALPISDGSAGQITVATGLTSVDLLTVWLVCTDAGGDAGYSQNDEVEISAVIWDVGASDYNYNYVITRSGQNVYVIRPKAGTPKIPNKSTGDDATFDPTKWKFKVYARYVE